MFRVASQKQMLKINVYHSNEKRFEDIPSKYTCDLEKGNGNEMV